MTQTLIAQNLMTGWEKWQYMMGAWDGEGSGQPGSGSGSYTLKPKLGGCILERKGVTDIPAMGGRPAVHHEDVMIVYKNQEGNPVKAIYFDNENHVIPYDITYSDNKIVLVSEVSQGGPRFRLTYEKLEDKVMNIRFEMAMPGAPYDFKMYLEGKNRKTKKLIRNDALCFSMTHDAGCLKLNTTPVYFPFITKKRFTKLIRAGALAEL